MKNRTSAFFVTGVFVAALFSSAIGKVQTLAPKVPLLKKITSTLILTLSMLSFLSTGLLSQNAWAGCCMKSNFKCENTDTAEACEKLDKKFIFWNGLKVCKKKRYCSASKRIINIRPIPEKNPPLQLISPKVDLKKNLTTQ